MISLPNLSLQKKISLLVLAGLAVGLGLFSWLGIQSLKDSTDRALNERLTIARIMADHLDETLAHTLTHLQGVADLIDRLPPEAEFRLVAGSLRQTFAESDIYIQGIILTDNNGSVIWVEPDNAMIAGPDMATYPEINQVLETGRPAISNLIASPPLEMPVVLAIAPISSRNGDIIGILVGAIDIERSGIGTFGQAIQVGNTGYIEIVDGNGVVLARSTPGSPPAAFEKSDHPGRFAELISEGKATVRTCHRCHEDGQELQRRRDVLAFAPLTSATWGVAIRQTEEEALAPTQQLERRLFFLGATVLIGTLFLVWIMMQGIVKPVKLLTAAAQRVAAGNFKTAVLIRRRDEIGQLSAAFSTMTEDLAMSRDELMSRNEELSALNSIAITVSQSLNLKQVLTTALQKVLEVTRTSAGCVFLSDAGGRRLEMTTCIGTSKISECREAGLAEAGCACHKVLRHGETLLVNHVSQCPRLGDETLKEDIDYFVCVPLKSRDRTLGIMNIACSGEPYFTENDFRLLDSIGSQIGLAIENSILYEEAKQKEQLRGELLNRVISAQEEERKRIARELHDDYGQTLTGVIMGMESVEEMLPPGKSKLKEKVANSRSLVTRALEDIRRLTFDLRPSVLDDLGLISAIREYAHNHLEKKDIPVKFEGSGIPVRLSPAVETALFRIIQEATHNIIKHARASHVRMHLSLSNGNITVIVEDDGRGFDVDAAFKPDAGRQSMGLLGIRERTALLGGTFTISSEHGKGTRLKVEIPLVISAAGSSDQPG